jgi:hypothetical protein
MGRLLSIEVQPIISGADIILVSPVLIVSLCFTIVLTAGVNITTVYFYN